MSRLILNEKSNKLVKEIIKNPKIINMRKPISKVMSIDNFLNKGRLPASPKVNSTFSIYSSQKSYVSPIISFDQNKLSKKSFNKFSPTNHKSSIYLKVNKSKKNVKPLSNISPKNKNNNILNHSIKSNLYKTNNNNNNNSKKKVIFQK